MDKNYIKKTLAKSDEEIQRLEIISEMALDFLIEGIKCKIDGKIKDANELFACAYGFNILQEFGEGMNVCDRLMTANNINSYQLEEMHEYGLNMAIFAMNLPEAVKNQLHPEKKSENRMAKYINSFLRE